MKKINYSKEFLISKDYYERYLNKCNRCPLLQNHNCRLLVEPREDNDGCDLRRIADVMTEEKALLILHKHQVWRRGNIKKNMISPTIIGFALDVAIHSLRACLKKKGSMVSGDIWDFCATKVFVD